MNSLDIVTVVYERASIPA